MRYAAELGCPRTLHILVSLSLAEHIFTTGPCQGAPYKTSPQPSVPRWCFYYNLENLKFGSVFLKGNEGTIWPLWFSWLLMVYYLCRPCGVDRSSGMLNSQYDTTVQCTEYMPPLDSVQWLWCPSKGQTSDWLTGKTKGPLLVLARKTSTHRREWWWGGEGGWQRCWTWGGWHVKTNAKVVIMNTGVGPINSWTWLAVREKGREPMRRVRFIGFQWHLGSNLICGISERHKGPTGVTGTF